MRRRTRRIAFVVFAAALFIGTHIPDLRVRVGTIERPDLLIHLTAFGSWFALLLATEWFGAWRSTRSIAVCAVIAATYAAVDEGSQSVPGLNRTAAWDDFAANVLGVTIAALLALALARWLPSRQDPAHVGG